jgi:hypothetical protein
LSSNRAPSRYFSQPPLKPTQTMLRCAENLCDGFRGFQVHASL